MAVKLDRTIGAVVAMARSASPMDSSERHWLYVVFAEELYPPHETRMKNRYSKLPNGETRTVDPVAHRRRFINKCLEVDKNE